MNTCTTSQHFSLIQNFFISKWNINNLQLHICQFCPFVKNLIANRILAKPTEVYSWGVLCGWSTNPKGEVGATYYFAINWKKLDWKVAAALAPLPGSIRQWHQYYIFAFLVPEHMYVFSWIPIATTLRECEADLGQEARGHCPPRSNFFRFQAISPNAYAK